MAAEKIKFYLSGGTLNANPDLSIGGAISTTQLFGQTVSYTATAIAGVTLLDGAGNDEGVGSLEFILTGSKLRWTKPGGAAATVMEEVDVSADGNYVLKCKEEDAFITVSVASASLPAADATESVDVSAILYNLFPAVSQAQSRTGKVIHRCIYLKNTTAGAVTVKIWVLSDLSGPDYLAIGTRYATSGTPEQLLSAESNAPVSVTFSAPTTPATALTVTLSANDFVGLWIRQTVDPLTIDGAALDKATLAFEVV